MSQTEADRKVEALMKIAYERGVELGIEQAERRSALRLMEARFGPLAPEVRRQVEVLPREALVRLQIDLLTTQAVGGTPPERALREQVRQTLRDLIEHHGRALCNDPERCKGLLQDACPTSRREIFLLVSALEEQVVADLLAGLGGRSWNEVADRLAHRLVDNRALADHAASWAVESWALALGVITQAALRNPLLPQPSPGPPVAPASHVITTHTAQITLKLIPAGEFRMGSPDEDHKAEAAEKPRHTIRISRAFYLGITPVTQAQYAAVMGTNPSEFYRWPENPVERVSWFDATAFCNALSKEEGLAPYYVIPSWNRVMVGGGEGYRLPTEAEWEYACRAGTETRYSFGDDAATPGEYAWDQMSSKCQTGPVGRKRPNAWGLYDMHGNVWEWCWDWYDEDYYRSSPGVDPLGAVSADYRSFRGGSWHVAACYLRSAYRGSHAPEYRHSSVGFRVARGSSVR
jgi:formylglycine-generating enzyme required for sulfatase activity